MRNTAITTLDINHARPPPVSLVADAVTTGVGVGDAEDEGKVAGVVDGKVDDETVEIVSGLADDEGRGDDSLGSSVVVSDGEAAAVVEGTSVCEADSEVGTMVAGAELSVVTGTAVSELAVTVGAAGRLTELVTVPWTPVTGIVAVDTGFPSE